LKFLFGLILKNKKAEQIIQLICTEYLQISDDLKRSSIQDKIRIDLFNLNISA
jgi:hypothetical protein